MNMKKLMAVVLAVVMAISAMALTAFAKEQRIELFNYASTSKNEVTWTFDIPVYALYGYISYNNYLEVVLPDNLTKDDTNPVDIKWSIEVNGSSTDLKSVKVGGDGNGNQPAPAKGSTTYYKQYVNFGAFLRPYIYYNGTEEWATVAQATMVNQVQSIKLIAKMTYPDQWDHSKDTSNYAGTGFINNNYNMYVQMWEAKGATKDYGSEEGENDDILVSGSKIYAANINTTKTSGVSTNKSGVRFKDVDFTWDHNIDNRSYVLGATSAKLVIKLKGNTNGLAFYVLKGAFQSKNAYDTGENWWNAPQGDKNGISTCMVNSNVTELVFDVPTDQLYNPTYGLFNGKFSIQTSYQTDASNFPDRKFNGQDVKYSDEAEEIYLLLTLPDDETPDLDIGGDEPVEPVDPQPEDPSDDEPTIDLTEPGDDEPAEEPKDENPPMGIALAVIPMMVAAAAVAVSKKR